MWPFHQVKQAIIQHEVKATVTQAITGQPTLSAQTKAWLVSLATSTIGAAFVGGVTVVVNGHIQWGPTITSYFFLVIHMIAKSPMPREVWTDAQRLAQQRIDAIDLAHQKSVADAEAAAKRAIVEAENAKALADAKAAKDTAVAQVSLDAADAAADKAKKDGNGEKP
jgi:hypothetical protein